MFCKKLSCDITIRLVTIMFKVVNVILLHRVQVAQFKTQPNNNQVLRYKNELRIWSSPVTLGSTSPWLLGRCSHQKRKSYADANTVYSRAERVFILEHYFTPKLSAAVHKAISNAYLDKEVPNKVTRHRLVTKFWVDACLREGGGHFQHML
jgi:hypothetical protein